MHTDIARSFMKSIRPLIPQFFTIRPYSSAHNQIELISGSGAVALRFGYIEICRYFTMFKNVVHSFDFGLQTMDNVL